MPNPTTSSRRSIRRARQIYRTPSFAFITTTARRGYAFGNGMRCVADLERGRTGKDNAQHPPHSGLLKGGKARTGCYTVEHGAAAVQKWNEIPLVGEVRDTPQLQIGPIDKPSQPSRWAGPWKSRDFLGRSDVNAHDLARAGPLLENHPIFPERASITLAHITARETWLSGRGKGAWRRIEACGSAACAGIAVAHG